MTETIFICSVVVIDFPPNKKTVCNYFLMSEKFRKTHVLFLQIGSAEVRTGSTKAIDLPDC